MKNRVALGLLSLASLITPALAIQQWIWTDGIGDQMWTDTRNWSGGVVPTATSAVQIGTQPTGDQIAIDTAAATTVASFTFNNTLSNIVDIAPYESETLQVNGAITNNSLFADSFSLSVIAGANAVWSGPLSFTAPTGIGTHQITLSNAITFSELEFDITDVTTYGRLLGAGTANVTGATINIGGSYTGGINDSFDFTSGNFAGATLGTLPTLSGALAWNTSNFLTNGTLSVIPEPGSWSLLGTGLAAATLVRRRRRRA